MKKTMTAIALGTLISWGSTTTPHSLHASEALYSAAYYGQIYDVENFLRAGHNVNWVNAYGSTPLHIAAYNGHIDIVRLLINAGANINVVANDGTTPLFVAAQRGHTAVVRILIDNHANLYLAANGYTPLDIARMGGFTPIVQMLEWAQNPYPNYSTLYTPLQTQTVSPLEDRITVLEHNLAQVQLDVEEMKRLTNIPLLRDIEGIKSTQAEIYYNDIFKRFYVTMLAYLELHTGKIATDNGKVGHCGTWANVLIGTLSNLPSANIIATAVQEVINSYQEHEKRLRINNVYDTFDSPTQLYDISRKVAIVLAKKYQNIIETMREEDLLKSAKSSADVMYHSVSSGELLQYKRAGYAKTQDNMVDFLVQKAMVSSQVPKLPITEAPQKITTQQTASTQKMTLIEAVKANLKIEDIKKLIQQGAAIDAEDQEGNSALNWVARYLTTDIELVKLLVENGANVNHKNKKGHTPLRHLQLSNTKFLLLGPALPLYAIGSSVLGGHNYKVNKVAKYLESKGAKAPLL